MRFRDWASSQSPNLKSPNPEITVHRPARGGRLRYCPSPQTPELNRRLDEAAKRLRQHRSVRVVAHHDADGIAAASVLFRALTRRGAKVRVNPVGRVSEDLRADLAGEGAVVFCDLGSQAVAHPRSRAEIIHLDHHPVSESLRGWMVNPWLDGLDGTEAVSSAGLAYLLARRLGPCGDLAGVALACGDAAQRERGLALWHRFQEALIRALRALRPRESRLLRVVRAPERNLGGALASVAARCFPADRALVVLHEGPDGVKVSARALGPLRERGVDLGAALDRAAFRAGGAGGGHPVAAGATLPAGTADEFLRSVEEVVGGQPGGAP